MINSLVQIIQIIGSTIPIVGIIALFYKKQSMSSMYLILTNIGCLVMNIGYWMLLRSSLYEEALLAYKMEYIGGTMFYLFFGLFVVSYFSKRATRKGFYIWTVFEMFPLLALLGDEWNCLLFKSISFETHPVYKFHYMNIDPQPLYMIRYGIIATVLVGGMIVTTIFLFKSKVYFKTY